MIPALLLASRLTLTLTCDAAVARPELLSLLDLELPHSEAVIRIDATPCTPTAPLTITVDAQPPLTIDLPPTERARTLALLLADLIRHPTPPTSLPASAPASASASPSAPVWPPPAAAPASAPVPSTPSSPPALRLQPGLSYLRRRHPEPAASGDGLRLSLPWRATTLPWLALAVDATIDELTSTTAVRVDSVRAGFLVGPRVSFPHGLATYAALRGELSRSWAATTMDTMPVTIRSAWGASATAIFGGELTLTSSLGLRLEIELGRTLSPVDVDRRYTEAPAPPPDQLDVIAGDFRTISVGVFVR